MITLEVHLGSLVDRPGYQLKPGETEITASTLAKMRSDPAFIEFERQGLVVVSEDGSAPLDEKDILHGRIVELERRCVKQQAQITNQNQKNADYFDCMTDLKIGLTQTQAALERSHEALGEANSETETINDNLTRLAQSSLIFAGDKAEDYQPEMLENMILEMGKGPKKSTFAKLIGA